MRTALDRLLRDLTLVSLALAIALGWSLFRFASGFSELVATLFIDSPETAELYRVSQLSEPLTWSIGDRILTLGPLLRGSIELSVVLAVALVIHNRYGRDDTGRFPKPS